MVSEYDLCRQLQASCCSAVWEATGVEEQMERASVLKLLEAGASFASRMLPLAIIGKRAGSTVHKGQQLLRVLTLESGCLQTTLDRTVSILTDFGVEAGIYTMQATSGEMSLLFRRALPRADGDHALHHIMGELEYLDSWSEFKETLSAVARTFKTYHKLDRFRAPQLNNRKLCELRVAGS